MSEPEPSELPVFSQILATLSIGFVIGSVVTLFVSTTLFAPLLGVAYALRAMASWWADRPIPVLVWVCLGLCVLLTLLPAG